MAIELSTAFQPHVDEQFTAESKLSLLTNNDFSWTGAHTIKVYTVSTSSMNDYGRTGALEGNWSRYGTVESLDATTQELTLKKDRSFTYAIDRLDEDETMRNLNAATSLARQNREVCIPEVDSYVYGVMAEGAGNKPTAKELTSENIYDEIINASEVLDNALVPEENRRIVVSPAVYRLMKKSPDITMETEVGQEMKIKGVVAYVDGYEVIKVPANRLPEKFGFMVAHPCATVAPKKLESFKIHNNPPGISGDLVEGRICYDAFVLKNKKNAIYYQMTV